MFLRVTPRGIQHNHAVSQSTVMCTKTAQAHRMNTLQLNVPLRLYCCCQRFMSNATYLIHYFLSEIHYLEETDNGLLCFRKVSLTRPAELVLIYHNSLCSHFHFHSSVFLDTKSVARKCYQPLQKLIKAQETSSLA